jgi:hypothetical protein
MRCMAEGVPFDESEKPGYDQGRELVVEPQPRSVAEIMQNNGTLGSRAA